MEKNTKEKPVLTPKQKAGKIILFIGAWATVIFSLLTTFKAIGAITGLILIIVNLIPTLIGFALFAKKEKNGESPTDSTNTFEQTKIESDDKAAAFAILKPPFIIIFFFNK